MTPVTEAATELIGGRYRRGDVIGRGGSAVVVRARDEHVTDASTPGAWVALKLLHPHLCEQESARRAFLREARHSEQLDHPAIVRVLDAGVHDDDGRPVAWLALDLCEGDTLRERVRKSGPLDPLEAVAVVASVLDGLAVAHAHHVVHRDLAPQNIVLTGEKNPAARILDFGLADITGRSTLGSDVLLAGEARGDLVIGSVEVMSPEQARGRPVRSVSDLYQAGCLLYFAVTGSPPFPRESARETLRAHVSAPVPLPSRRVPSAWPLDAVVQRAMSKTPAHRYRTAADMRAALLEAGEVMRQEREAGVEYAHPAAEATAALPLEVAANGEPAPVGAAAAGAVAAAGARSVGDGALDNRAVSASGADAGAPSVPAANAHPRPNRSRWMRWTAAAVVATLVLAGGLLAAILTQRGEVSRDAAPVAPAPATAVASGGGDHPASDVPSHPKQTTPVESSPANGATGGEPPAPAMVHVPALTGSIERARVELASLGLQPELREQRGSAPAGTVLGQEPAPGAALPRGRSVVVIVASGRNSVPNVVGLSPLAALEAMEKAGFTVRNQDAVRAATRGAVRASQPSAGVEITVGSGVSLVLDDGQSATSEPLPTPTPRGGA